MRNNGSNGGFPPVPIQAVEMYDASLRALVEAKKAEFLWDGSREFFPFNLNTPTKSRKYKKSYLVSVSDGYKVHIRLIFDYRDGKNIGYINVSEKGRELLKKDSILNIGEN